MVIKRKTVTKVARALKTTNTKVKDVAVQETKSKVMKIVMKAKPAPKAAPKAAAKAQKGVFLAKQKAALAKKKVAEKAKKGKKAVAEKAKQKKKTVEKDEEEEEEEEESEEEEETKSAKTMKRPAAAGKKMQVEKDDESEEDEEEDEDEDEEEDEDDDDEDEEEAETKVMKKPAAAAQKKAEEEEEEDDDDDDDDEDDDDEEDMSGQLVAVDGEKEKSEKELLAERTKELKAMPASDLKELMESNGLEKGTKEAMIKTLLKHEAKVQATAKEHKAKIRNVVVQKKQELENLSTAELNKLCNNAGLKGLKSRPERVQRLLVQWQENDGVDQALGKIAQEERKTELNALEPTKLRKLCSKFGVDPFVKEIMVERISKDENQRGCYTRPAIRQADSEAPKDRKGDMIDELLASEAERKKERILREKKEAALTKRRKELKSMSVEELKKRIAKKGLEASGKREEMVETLFIASVQEDTAVERKSELQSKSLQELKELLTLNGLETGSKDQMVKTMLAHEAKTREALRSFQTKVEEAAAQKRSELEKKANAQLKELCASKGLPTKGEKNERVERIIEESKKELAFDRTVSSDNRNKRKDELMKLEKPTVLKLCESTGVDPCVKDIMVERIMTAESEAGEAIAAGDREPAAKKARTSKK